MKIMAKYCLICFALCSFTAQASSEYQQWLANQSSDFNAYVNEQDQAFSTYLKQQWQLIDVDQPLNRTIDKPDQSPIFKEFEAPSSTIDVPATPFEEPIITSRPLLDLPGQVFSVNFYQRQISIRQPKKYDARLPLIMSEAVIADAWLSMASFDASQVLNQLAIAKQDWYLNDWDYVQLLKSYIATQVDLPNEQKLLLWFLLNQAGYQTHIAFDKTQLYVFMATQQPLYEVKYITVNNEPMYSTDLSSQLPNQLFTYEKPFSKAKRRIGFMVNKKINLAADWQFKSKSFSHNGERYRINFPYSDAIVAHLDNYPQLDLISYFSQPMHEKIQTFMQDQLTPLLTGLSDLEKANLLLHMVQTSFDYQTDQQQFGKENHLFVMESIFYPYADCEDRSLFYARLMNDILNINVLVGDYPNHVSTAIEVDIAQGSGQSFRVSGGNYAIADPTYINANVGDQMPGLTKPKSWVVVN